MVEQGASLLSRFAMQRGKCKTWGAHWVLKGLKPSALSSVAASSTT